MPGAHPPDTPPSGHARGVAPLCGRPANDIPPQNHEKRQTMQPSGRTLAVPSGICTRVADGALHTPVAAARLARQTPSVESCPHQTSQNAARWLAALARSVQPERGTGLAPMSFRAPEGQGPSHVSSCGRLRRHRQQCCDISHHPPLTARTAHLPGAEDSVVFRDTHRRVPQAVAPLSTMPSVSAGRR